MRGRLGPRLAPVTLSDGSSVFLRVDAAISQALLNQNAKFGI
jgi:hypothetical protein